MNIAKKWVLGFGLSLLAGGTQAGLLIRSIDVSMVETKFDSTRTRKSDESAFDRAIGKFDSAWANPNKRICDMALQVFEGISSHDSCDGPKNNIGTLFTIAGSVTAPTQLQLGLDWGRGGFTMLTGAGLTATLQRYKSDIWWHKSWDNVDVLNLFLPITTDFLLVGLGFEGCCDGFNSARWRSGGDAGPSGFAVGAEAPGDWQTLAVNVPEPGVAYLLGLGLAGFAYSRRTRRV